MDRQMCCWPDRLCQEQQAHSFGCRHWCEWPCSNFQSHDGDVDQTICASADTTQTYACQHNRSDDHVSFLLLCLTDFLSRTIPQMQPRCYAKSEQEKANAHADVWRESHLMNKECRNAFGSRSSSPGHDQVDITDSTPADKGFRPRQHIAAAR